MKLAAGLAAFALLATGLAASADEPKRKLYNALGKECSDAEAAARPVVHSSSKVQNTPLPSAGFNNASGCRTATEWRLVRAAVAERQREQDRYFDNLRNTVDPAPLPQ